MLGEKDQHHLDSLRLFDAAAGSISLTKAEEDHLFVCEDCQEILKTFQRQFRNMVKKDPRNRRTG